MYFDEREAHRLIVAISADTRYVEHYIKADIDRFVINKPQEYFNIRYGSYFKKLYAYIDRLSGIISLPHKELEEDE